MPELWGPEWVPSDEEGMGSLSWDTGPLESPPPKNSPADAWVLSSEQGRPTPLHAGPSALRGPRCAHCQPSPCSQGALRWPPPSSWGRFSSARASSSPWLHSSTSREPASCPRSSMEETEVPLPARGPRGTAWGRAEMPVSRGKASSWAAWRGLGCHMALVSGSGRGVMS